MRIWTTSVVLGFWQQFALLLLLFISRKLELLINLRFELKRWHFILGISARVVLQKVKVFSEWHAVTIRAIAFQYSLWALNTFSLTNLHYCRKCIGSIGEAGGARRKWILNICIQKRRLTSQVSIPFSWSEIPIEFLILCNTSKAVAECQIKDWSFFEQKFRKSKLCQMIDGTVPFMPIITLLQFLYVFCPQEEYRYICILFCLHQLEATTMRWYAHQQ